MSDNAAWLANLKVDNEVGVYNSNGGSSIGKVKRILEDKIEVSFGNSLSCYNRDGRSFWNTYGTSWLVPADADFKDRVENKERRAVAMEVINEARWGYLPTETLERIAAIIREEQIK